MRGNHLRCESRAGRRGSIPACAGEPGCADFCFSVKRVYPRVCGGTRAARCRRPSALGLSPRVRGNRRLFPWRLAMRRSIPACAGEPLRSIFREMRIAVYPRVCGGTRSRRPPVRSLKGLSPRVRGNPLPSSFLPRKERSIPACAGEPEASAPKMTANPVYPRVCGGTAGIVVRE